MSNGNEFVSGSNAAQLDLSPLIESIKDELQEWKNKEANYTGLHTELLPYLAEASVRRLKDGEVAKVSEWKLAGGGSFTNKTYDALECLKNEMKAAIRKRLNCSASDEYKSLLNTYPNPNGTGIEAGCINNEYYIKNIRTYEPAENGSLSAVSCTVSFDWDTLRREFASFQMGGPGRENLAELEEALKNGEIDAEDEEYQNLFNERQELYQYAGTKLEMSDALRKYLMPEIMLAAADSLEKQKDSGIQAEDIQKLRLYAERLKEFIRLADDKNSNYGFSFGDPYGFRNFIYDSLPVIPMLEAESVLNASNPEDPMYRLEYNVVFKLNGINSTAEPDKNAKKNPRYAAIEKIHSKEDDEKKSRYHMQLYALMYYLDNGVLPSSDLRTVREEMACYEPLTDYNRLAETVSASCLLPEKVWTGYLYFDQISADMLHNSSLIHVSNDMPKDFIIPVSFRIVQRRFEKTGTQASEIKYSKTINGQYAGAVLCHEQRSRQDVKDHKPIIADGKTPFISVKTQIAVSREETPERLGNGYRSERIILYDIAYATITTLFFWLSIHPEDEENNAEGVLPDRTQFLLGRYYRKPAGKKEKKTDEEEKPNTPGSDLFLTAFGYAAEQAVSSESVITTTQGYIEDANGYKRGNSLNSLLQKSDIRMENRFGLFRNDVGIIYITAKQCDKNGAGKKQEQGVLSLRMSDGIEIITPPDPETKIIIRHLPGTSEICSCKEVYQFRKNMKLYRSLEQMQKDGVKCVILLMDAPYMITTSQAENTIVGLSNDNLQTLEEDFPDLSFLPLYIGKYQIRADQSPRNEQYYAIRNIYKLYQNDDGSWNGGNRIPLNTYVLGHSFAGNKKNGYRTGTMYEVLRDYYSGRTGELIEQYLQEKNGAELRSAVFNALLSLHIITNEKCNKDNGEGKCSPFARLKQDIAPGSIVTYKRGRRDDRRDPDFTFNYTAYLSVLVDILEKKGNNNVQTGE